MDLDHAGIVLADLLAMFVIQGLTDILNLMTGVSKDSVNGRIAVGVLASSKRRISTDTVEKLGNILSPKNQKN